MILVFFLTHVILVLLSISILSLRINRIFFWDLGRSHSVGVYQEHVWIILFYFFDLCQLWCGPCALHEAFDMRFATQVWLKRGWVFLDWHRAFDFVSAHVWNVREAECPRFLIADRPPDGWDFGLRSLLSCLFEKPLIYRLWSWIYVSELVGSLPAERAIDAKIMGAEYFLGILMLDVRLCHHDFNLLRVVLPLLRKKDLLTWHSEIARNFLDLFLEDSIIISSLSFSSILSSTFSGLPKPIDRRSFPNGTGSRVYINTHLLKFLQWAQLVPALLLRIHFKKILSGLDIWRALIRWVLENTAHLRVLDGRKCARVRNGNDLNRLILSVCLLQLVVWRLILLNHMEHTVWRVVAGPSVVWRIILSSVI